MSALVWSKNKGGGGAGGPGSATECDTRAFRVFVLLIKLVLLFWIFSFPLPSWWINLARSASTLNNSLYAAKISLRNRRLDGKRTTKGTSAGTTETHKR